MNIGKITPPVRVGIDPHQQMSIVYMSNSQEDLCGYLQHSECPRAQRSPKYSLSKGMRRFSLSLVRDCFKSAIFPSLLGTAAYVIQYPSEDRVDQFRQSSPRQCLLFPARMATSLLLARQGYLQTQLLLSRVQLPHLFQLSQTSNHGLYDPQMGRTTPYCSRFYSTCIRDLGENYPNILASSCICASDGTRKVSLTHSFLLLWTYKCA